MDDNNITIAAEIVAAYVTNNSVAAADLTRILAEVHSSLQRLSTGGSAPAVEEQKLVPAVPVRKSVTPDFIICLEDGKKFKSLKRHLSTSYSLTPGEYRTKWGLPDEYPMVAPNYAAQRSALAKSSGLGNMRAKSALASAKKR